MFAQAADLTELFDPEKRKDGTDHVWVTAAYLAPVTRNGSALVYPPIHLHHAHIEPPVNGSVCAPRDPRRVPLALCCLLAFCGHGIARGTQRLNCSTHSRQLHPPQARPAV